jgi:hypothetical protein
MVLLNLEINFSFYIVTHDVLVLTVSFLSLFDGFLQMYSYQKMPTTDDLYVRTTIINLNLIQAIDEHTD